jgi:hypothetical protein
MSGRWTRRDERERREHAEADEYARAIIVPLVAARLGIPAESLRVTLQKVAPCRHWRCRLARLRRRLIWNLPLLLAGLALILAAAALAWAVAA